MCSLASPEIGFASLSNDPRDWGFFLSVILAFVVIVYLVFRRFKPGIPRRLAIALFILTGALFVAGFFLSRIVSPGYDNAFYTWYWAPSTQAILQTCSSDSLAEVIQSHDALAGQISSLSSNLIIAAIILSALYGVILGPVLDSHGRRKATV
jgi:hypothetical protein